MKTEEKPVKSALCPEEIHAAIEKNPFDRIGDIVYSMLESAILSSELEPGQKINIAKLANKLDVSATPVREAMEKLADRGFITVEKKENAKYSNYYVFDISDKSFTDLFVARNALENAAVAICADKYWRLDLDALHETVDNFRNGLERVAAGDREAAEIVRKNDRRFHEMILEFAGNKYLTEMYEQLKSRFEYLSVRTMGFLKGEQNPENILILARQHEKIYNAISLGFSNQAHREMTEHLNFCINSCLRNKYMSRDCIND